MLEEEIPERSHAVVPGLGNAIGDGVWPVGVVLLSRLRDVGDVGGGGDRWEDGHIPLGDHDADLLSGEGEHRLLELVDRRVVDSHVALHSDGVDAQSARLDGVDEREIGVASAWGRHAVVVEIELGVGVGLVGEAEGVEDELGAENLVEWRLPVGPVFDDDLIADIPAADLPLVSPDDGVDMVADALAQDFGRDVAAKGVDAEPWGHLRMPKEAVAYELHVILLREGHDTVGSCEVVGVGVRVDHFALHAILGHDGIEMRGENAHGLGVGGGDLGCRGGRADGETVSDGGFERWWCGLVGVVLL